jgi:hypothetical protein
MEVIFSACRLSRLTPVLLLSASLAHSALIYTKVSQDSLTVGDRIELRIEAIVPPGAVVVPPPTDAGFGSLIVKEWSVNKAQRPSSDSLWYHYLLTTYSPEPCTIPSLPYAFVKKDSLWDTLHTEAIPLRVISLVPASDADTVNIRDLKPQQTAGKPSLWWLWTLLALACAAGAAYAGRALWLRFKKSPPPPPPKPPYDEAMEALAFLDTKQYLAKGMVREYAFELSEILKRYVGRRFETNALEFTTEEMMDWIETAALEVPLKRSLGWFFAATDPVKFAKQIPSSDIAQKFGTEARAFVEATKPPDKAEAQPPQQAPEKGGSNAVS